MKRSSTTLAIVSGKGGVGKSVTAVNVACALAADGHAVALLDADLGQGACAVLLNEAPAHSVLDLLRQTARPDDVFHPAAAGLTLVQAVDEPGDVVGREEALFHLLDATLTRLRRTHAFVVIDAPAGVGPAVRWALDRADLGALILVDEPTAIADAYRLAKQTWQADPAYPFAGIVNLADTEAEARSVADRFGAVTTHFAGTAPDYLGWVPFSARIRQSVRFQTPAALGDGAPADAFARLARTLAAGRPAPVEAVGDRMRLV